MQAAKHVRAVSRWSPGRIQCRQYQQARVHASLASFNR